MSSSTRKRGGLTNGFYFLIGKVMRGVFQDGKNILFGEAIFRHDIFRGRAGV